jgi:hypothetical protein
LSWDGLDGAGMKAASGVYFYQLKTEYVMRTNKMILMK